MPTAVRIKITAKRQATFPAAALRALKAKPGDYLTLTEERGTWRLESAATDHAKLAPLRSHITAGKVTALNLSDWRDTPKDHARLRD
ncbi:MAG: hypothetical protein H7Y06_06415 [Opitutaceae bacterium]|nr:hypothetical protein [Opitutaceae bacterium]